MVEIDVIDALRYQHRVLQATARGASRMMQRVALLNANDFDYGEEGIRLGNLHNDFASVSSSITKSIRLIKSGKAMGEEASKLYDEIVEGVELAKATLDDIQVPKLYQIAASERYNAL